RRYAAQGRAVVLVGHAGHPEVVGTLGQIEGEVHLVATPADVAALPIPPDRPVAYITQTTLSVDDTRAVIAALEGRFADLAGPDTRDICYATQNRQMAVRALAARVEVLLVVGAPYSSNSRRLQEIGAASGVSSYLVPDAASLRQEWFRGAGTVGITAGASAPERLVQEVVTALGAWWPVEVSTLPGIVEDVAFKLPAALAAPEADAAA
ncbi:MAG TPA: 4-hydroxy-3-methylbut-2-enyl diphosphate reductase, partial [Crenalkalicoccus sp.]|nr:4-hydroxy-3-methylbut-2-enyl diphosphate reductase [Crenalkalicoccus sp.]